MSENKFSLKDFIEKKHKKTAVTSPKPKKTKGGLADSWFTTGTGGNMSGDGGGNAAIGESLLSELFQDMGGSMPMATKPYHSAQLTQFDDDGDSYEEEAEQKGVKIEQARRIFKEMMADKESTRTDIIERFEKEVKVTHSTAVSYYTRFRKEFGLSDDDSMSQGAMVAGSNAGGEAPTHPGAGTEAYGTPVGDAKPEMQEFTNPDRAGIIRVVDNAHLIYKRQTENGTFEELRPMKESICEAGIDAKIH